MDIEKQKYLLKILLDEREQKDFMDKLNKMDLKELQAYSAELNPVEEVLPDGN